MALYVKWFNEDTGVHIKNIQACECPVCTLQEYTVWQPQMEISESNLAGVLVYSTSTTLLGCARRCSYETECVVFTYNSEDCKGFSDFSIDISGPDVGLIQGQVFYNGRKLHYTRDLQSGLIIRSHYSRLARSNASLVCSKEGGRLVSLDTLQKQNRILDVVGNGLSYQIGLNDIHSEGNWVWDNGNPFVLFSQNYTTQFNNYDGVPGSTADCGVIQPRKKHFYDISCNRKFPFICEKVV